MRLTNGSLVIGFNIMKWPRTKTAVVAGVVLILVAGAATMERMAPNVPFLQESITRADQAKELALACILFAHAHGNQLPKNFEQFESTESKAGLADAKWEIVSGGDVNSIANPGQTILLREKEARKSPHGGFVKTYAFADGHADRLWSPDNEFAALEKKRGFLTQTASADVRPHL